MLSIQGIYPASILNGNPFFLQRSQKVSIRPETGPKGSGTLMTRLYKEKTKCWDTINWVLTFHVLIWAIIPHVNDTLFPWALWYRKCPTSFLSYQWGANFFGHCTCTLVGVLHIMAKGYMPGRRKEYSTKSIFNQVCDLPLRTDSLHWKISEWE